MGAPHLGHFLRAGDFFRVVVGNIVVTEDRGERNAL